MGQALVAVAVERGHQVIACSRGPAVGTSSFGGKAVALGGLDLTDTAALNTLRQEVGQRFRERFSVISPVGYFPGYTDIASLGPGGARRVMESNYLTVYGVAHALLPLMLERGGGDFVNFSAHSQYQCYPKMAAFNCAKAAVEAFTLSLSNEYLRSGVRANCFALATMLTAEELRMKPKGDHAQWLKPEEVALRAIELVERADDIVSGNVIQLYKHSDSYFGQSYMSRIEG